MNKYIEDKKEVLEFVYNEDSEKISNMSNYEINELLRYHQTKSISNKKNPNNFFILNSLPSPKEFKTKTKAWVGILIFISFFIVMFLFTGMMFWLAYNH